MPKYVAFLRAINVGGHTVMMDKLRRMFEAIGFTNVDTFIASGNVVFDSPSKSAAALEKKIEAHLRESLGYAVLTFIRTTTELASIAQYKPFTDAELSATGHSLYIAFVAASPNDATRHKLLSSATAVDDFHIAGREVYWLCRKSLGESVFSGPLLEKTLGMPATVRNSTTVRKMALKYA